MIVLRHYQRRSANTRRLYARELLLFLAYCESGGQDPYAVRAEHVEDYLAVLSGAGLAEASRALALAAISAYYDRAVHAGAIDANPCAIVERPKPAADEQNQARALSRPQAAELLAAARTRSTLRELLACLLFFNGLRVSEAASADVEDLDEHQGHRVLRVRGKGKTEKNHRVPLNGPTITALGRWLNQRATIADAAMGPLLLPHRRPPAHPAGDLRAHQPPRPLSRRRPTHPPRAQSHHGHALSPKKGDR
jgi:integrase/recombinase XerD